MNNSSHSSYSFVPFASLEETYPLPEGIDGDSMNEKENFRPLRFLCIGDPHFKVDNREEMDIFVSYTVAFTRHLKEQGLLDFIVCLGDTLDRFGNIHLLPLSQAVSFFAQLDPLGPLFIIVGNHDRIHKKVFMAPENPFMALERWHNTKVAHKAMEEYIGGIRCVFIPYVHVGRFKEALETLGTSEIPLQARNTLIFAHQEFRKCKMGAKISEEGDEWPEENPIVISGHIHDYQHYQKNLFYVGTPIQHAYGDKADKGLALYRYGYRKGKGYVLREERYAIPVLPKCIVYLTPEEVKNYVPPSDKKVKIVVQGHRENIQVQGVQERIMELAKEVKVATKVAWKNKSKIPYKGGKNGGMDVRRGYLECLKDVVEGEGDNKEKEWFTKLFPGVSDDPSKP